MTSRTIGIIPARYASTRFPGKPLAVIMGETMIYRVYNKSIQALDEVYVATDDQRIADEVEGFGGRVLFTAPHHRSGTERCLEAAELLKAQSDDVIVNIQGDEPFIHPEQLAELTALLEDPSVHIGTLVKAFEDRETLMDPNTPKVVLDVQGRAMYFSRSPIPFLRDEQQKPIVKSPCYYKHIGLYGYRFAVLKEICLLPASKLETMESLEQLRWLEHGYSIHTAVTKYESRGIDTPEDINKVLAQFK